MTYDVDYSVEPIDGRPDLDGRDYGVTLLTRVPSFVYSRNGNGCVVHRVARGEARWYTCHASGGRKLYRLRRPQLSLRTVCGQVFYESRTTEICEMPTPDAMLCGRCLGDPATFGRDGLATIAGVTRKEAHAMLGCEGEGKWTT